ncbi:MAG: peptide-methionine (R)-S-oxide reductase MsrB [Alphaproteobacteria bacterium]|mgnify:FL=1|tara:strand:+ start:586 stop:1053 length:468 start_codon:yes stop_codon:yes gene_type:complete
MINLNRRSFIILSLGSIFAGVKPLMSIEKLELSDAEWQARLSEEEYYILRKEGTERPGTSVLNDEKRKGVYHCVGCEQPLFHSNMKFDSGTGWPSFFDYLPDALEFKTDFKLVIPRKEYHCSRCGGHHGHVFKDGPEPTGLRYCNNGLVLNFIPD